MHVCHSALLLLVLGALESSGRRWSSGYFTHRFFPEPAGRPARQAFLPEAPAGRSYRPSWLVADMGTMYKRASAAKKAPAMECQAEGEVCLVMTGLMGGAMKLPCCPRSSCTFTGVDFQCLAEGSDYGLPLEAWKDEMERK